MLHHNRIYLCRSWCIIAALKELFRQSQSILIVANRGDLRPSQVRDRFLHLENPAVVKPAPDERVKRQRQMRGKADAPPRAAVKVLQRIPADQHK